MSTTTSSSLLDQAIVDASALKEAAIKNAEASLVERYADDIKEAVTSLLEAPEDDPLGGMMGGEEEEAVAGVPEAPPAYADGDRLCPCPEDNQEVTIDFDALRQEVEAEEDAGGMPGEEMGGMGDLDAMAPEGEEEETEEDFLELEESALDKIAAALAEELTVDIKNVPSGHSGGSPEEAARHAEIALALARDTEVAEETKELKKAVKDLQEKLKSEKTRGNKLSSTAAKIAKKLVEVNLSNAKLLYTNRVLSSASLNERQKIKIVEAISSAQSVEEAKVLYETLQSTVESTSRRSPKSLSEAVSRNSLPFLAGRGSKVESKDPALERMQRLAGIKK
jgi:hypothetical protein